MPKSIVIAALILSAGTAFAAGEAREAKPVACANFNEFKDANGVAIGMCGATKPGGKARVLRSYVIARVVNPATDMAQPLMVGWQ